MRSGAKTPLPPNIGCFSLAHISRSISSYASCPVQRFDRSPDTKTGFNGLSWPAKIWACVRTPLRPQHFNLHRRRHGDRNLGTPLLLGAACPCRRAPLVQLAARSSSPAFCPARFGRPRTQGICPFDRIYKNYPNFSYKFNRLFHCYHV